MKLVAIFLLSCIAVTFAYPMFSEEGVEIQEGYPVVYNQKLNKWVPQASVQQKCEQGITCQPYMHNYSAWSYTA